MRKLLIMAATAGLLLAPFSNAQEADKLFYTGPLVSYFWLEDDRPFTNRGHDSGAVGGVIGWNIDAVQAWEFSAVTSTDIDAIHMNYVRKLSSDPMAWNPYLLGGVSWIEDDNAPNTAESSMDIQVGAGVAKFVDTDVEFRFDVRPHYIVGGIAGTRGWDLSANASLLWHFGEPDRPASVMAEPEPAPVAPPAPEMRTITIRLNVLFDFDESVVKAIYGDEIEQVANAMKVQSDLELVLEGHTDSIGTDDYNDGLSARRVEAVKAKLVEDYGIPASRISTRAYGESQPVATNDTDEGRAQNRRVVGVISWTEEVQ